MVGQTKRIINYSSWTISCSVDCSFMSFSNVRLHTIFCKLFFWSERGGIYLRLWLLIGGGGGSGVRGSSWGESKVLLVEGPSASNSVLAEGPSAFNSVLAEGRRQRSIKQQQLAQILCRPLPLATKGRGYFHWQHVSDFERRWRWSHLIGSNIGWVMLAGFAC